MLQLELSSLLLDLSLLAMAFIFVLPIGWDRERSQKAAGLRTFPIVSVASCAFILIGIRAFPDAPSAQARTLQGLITGIGFIGGGAILKRSETGVVEGLTTAASIWNTAAIGAAVAFRRFELALLLVLLNFGILRWLRNAKPSETDR